MTDKTNLFQIWNLSRKSGKSPSEILKVKEWASDLLGIEDNWTPFQFDDAIYYFGSWFENQIAEGKKPENLLSNKSADEITEDDNRRNIELLLGNAVIAGVDYHKST